MNRVGDAVGPYTLVSKLGRGSFGVVWLAERRTALAVTRVALKMPVDDEINLDAVRQEAAVWAQASGHPNVLPIIEANIYDEQIVIVSEYAPDGSVIDWLTRQGGVAPVAAAAEMLKGILGGLEHLHSRMIIHRDLKPANILLQGSTPRLADFGIARVLKATSQSGIIAGTPNYMAPEAFDGKRNEQTDLWSAGVIFYQLLTGRLPFPQTDITSLMGAIINRNPEPLPATVPGPIQEFLTRALHKDPAWRFRSAAEMREALEQAVRSISWGNLPQTERIGTSPNPMNPATAPTMASSNPAFGTAGTANPVYSTAAPTMLAPPPTPPVSMSTQSKKSSGMFWIVGALLVTVVMGGTLAGALYVYFKSQPQAAKPTVDPSDPPIKVSNTGTPPTTTPTPEPPKVPSLLPGSEGWYVVGFSSATREGADAESDKRNKEGFTTHVVETDRWEKLTPGYFAVVYGIYKTEADAKAVKQALDLKGISSFVKASGKPLAAKPEETKTDDGGDALPGRFPDASRRLLTPEELGRYNVSDLRLMRNEIFARHGYVFKEAALAEYFGRQPWYTPEYDDVAGFLSDIEKQNIERIRQAESR
jgi:serine/threonine-protein kinase